MILQKQKHCLGCGVACIAMVTGKTYDDVREVLFGEIGEVERIELPHIKVLLDRAGIISDLWPQNLFQTQKIPWPPAPGPQRIVEVRLFPDSQGTHMICVGEDGATLDPLFGYGGWNYFGNPVNMLTITKRLTE